MEIKKAVRHSVNLIISLSGPSGSGKTYSALLLAAGLAGPNGKIGFIDTENGRGCMYADSPGIVSAMPQGYDIIELTAPFSPARYMEALDTFERAGYNVVVVDSASHEWEGIGGCTDIAENNKLRGMPNWALAKKQHKLYVLRLLNSSMHVIVCLRAREKVKIIDKAHSDTGKDQVIPLGILPVAEKNFVYEAMLSFMVQEGTHFADPIKLPEQFQQLFNKAKLISKEDGEKIRRWNEGGTTMNQAEKLQRQARAAAEQGVAAYAEFFGKLMQAEKKVLADTIHADLKALAEQADLESKAAEEGGGRPE